MKSLFFPLARNAVVAGLALTAAHATAQQASITLVNGDADYCWVNNNDWSLTKRVTGNTITGQPGAGTVTWTIAATKTPGSTEFSVHGILTVRNTGSAPATIGNIVVNLQKPNTQKIAGKLVPWVSLAANCATGSAGDAATAANIVAAGSAEAMNFNAAFGAVNYTVSGAKGTFVETFGSGSLEFTDVNSNTVWAITPQQTIPVGGEVVLRYEATYDAGMIAALPVGTLLRVEALVSFGNAGGRGGSGASAKNIDINGNGGIDADELNVRTVPSRHTMAALPAGPEECNAEATVIDSGPTATGTVTMSNAVGFGAFPATINSTTLWEVSVDVEGGQDGGQVCNDAQLFSEGDGGVLLPTASVVNGGFEEPALAPGTWNVFAAIPGWTATFGPGIEVQNNVAGAPHGGSQHIELDSYGPSWMSQPIAAAPYSNNTLRFWYSPRPGVADNSIDLYVNGAFVMNLQADGSQNSDTVWTEYVHNFTANGPVTVEFRDTSVADSLGGYIDDVSIVGGISFVCCPDVELQSGECVPVPGGGGPPTGWPPTPGTYGSYSQGGYGGSGDPYNLLAANFATLFPNGVTIGVNDGLGPFHHATWTSAPAIQAYLPDGGNSTNGLTADTVNPTSTSGGNCASQATALTINIAMSDAAVLPVGLGDLYYHNAGDPLDGLKVRDILAAANLALGQGSGSLPAGYTYGSLAGLLGNLNIAFHVGFPVSPWAIVYLSDQP